MSRLLIPSSLLVLVCAGFLVFLVYSVPNLPERTATHFDADGRANGWMSRGAHVGWMVGMGVGLPLAIVGTSFLMRLLPPRLINVPRRDYWLAPERLERTRAYFVRHFLWFACLMVLFAAGMHALVLDANTRTPPRASAAGTWTLIGLFVAGVLAWTAAMLWHFGRGTDARTTD